jgi:hypothetical protein
MTPAKRIEIAHKACELLETGKQDFSCHAMGAAINTNGDFWPYRHLPAVVEYTDFYKARVRHCGEWTFSESEKEAKGERIMAVLFWAHCPESIRKGIK